jgi:hydrophobic/amphiphilic exporter-1 (mainly G- bacteria), HAE1 family
VVPLVIASGAGAAGQRALGTAVFGGMIASTVLAVFFVPVFFVLFQGLSEWLSPRPPEEGEAASLVALHQDGPAVAGSLAESNGGNSPSAESSDAEGAAANVPKAAGS